MRKGGVAFFDSGIGGLTVLAECLNKVNNSVWYYYGDNARAPYGNLPPDVIRKYVFEAFETFASLEAKVAVVACNTATAVCMDELREKYSFPIIGTEPALLPAAKVGGEILVLATRATVESARMRLLIKKAKDSYPLAKFHVEACDNLAGAIEKGGSFEQVKRWLPTCSADAVVLGCTHYVYFKEQLQNYYGVPVFDGNAGVALRLKTLLKSLENPPFSKKFAKNWDERPLLLNFDETHLKTALKVEANATDLFESENTNKCSQKQTKMDKNEQKSPNFAQIYFLGSGQTINLKKYEQMFVVNRE